MVLVDRENLLMSEECSAKVQVQCEGRLARIEQLLEDKLEQGEREFERFGKILEQHASKISRLEKWQHWVIGAGAVIGAVLTFFWEKIFGG